MESEVQTEAVFAKLNEERKTGELLPLPKEFYRNIEITFNSQSLKNAAEKQNMQATVNALKAKRTQKILIYIAYNKPIPGQIPEEEEVLYRQLLAIINKETAAAKTTRIKILIKIPEIITTNGNKIGPYQGGEIIQAENQTDVEFLINNKIGEIVER